jgi:hypothetical protein
MKVEILKQNGQITGLNVEKIDGESYLNWIKENSKEDTNISKFEYILAMNGKEVELTNEQIVDIKLIIEMEKNEMIKVRDFTCCSQNVDRKYKLIKSLVLNALDILKLDIDEKFICKMVDEIKSNMFQVIERNNTNKMIFLSRFDEILSKPIKEENHGLLNVILGTMEKIGENLK